MKVGESIKELRTSKNMTQKQLADALGVTQSWVGMYESGKRLPKPETLSKIAQALGVSIGDLGTGIDISAICAGTGGDAKIGKTMSVFVKCEYVENICANWRFYQNVA